MPSIHESSPPGARPHIVRPGMRPLSTVPDLLPVFNLPEWYRGALCAQTDVELFYPERGDSARPAKSVCAKCPVKKECLDDALARGERFGIWGGLSDRERRKLENRAPDPIKSERMKKAWAIKKAAQ